MFALCSAATPAAARPALARPAATRARVNCRAGPRRSADMVCSTKQEPLCPAVKELQDDLQYAPVEGANAKSKCIHPQRPVKSACADCPRRK